MSQIPPGPNVDFGRNLKAAYQARGFTATTLASKIGVDKSLISRWQKGVTRPRQENLVDLYSALGVTTFDLPADLFDKQFGFAQSRDHPHIEKLYIYTDDFKRRVLELARTAKLVRYCELCKKFSHSGRHRPLELADEIFARRLQNGEVGFQRIQVFYDKRDIVNAMADAHRFIGRQYYCHYFPTPDISIPTISISSFDDDLFIVGGYYENRAPHMSEYALIFDGREPVATFLREHWRVMWERSKLFPEPASWQSGTDLCNEFRINTKEWNQLIIDANKQVAELRRKEKKAAGKSGTY